MSKLRLSLLLAIVTLLVFPVPGEAQFDDSLSFTVTPAITEYAGNPGESVSGKITFTNSGDFPAAGTIGVETLIPIDDIIDQARRSEFDASAWIDISKPDVVLAPKQEHITDFTINIPPQANPGGHYALITLKPGIIQEPGADPTTTVTPELSASIFITVAGDINEVAELVEDDLTVSRITQGSSHTFSFRIRNTGNVHILPAPRITITRDDQVVEIFSLQPQLILPNTEKTFSADWVADVNPGSYAVRAETTYGSASIPLASPNQSFTVTPQFLHLLLIGLAIPLLAYIIIKRRNVPRMYAVLRGHAHFKGKHYKQAAGREDLPKNTDDTAIKAAAEELQKPQEILGYPEPESSEPPPPPAKATKQPGKDTQLISKTKVSGAQSTTFITQTSASTIVREASPLYDPEADSEVKPSTVITVQHGDTSRPAKPAAKKSVLKKATRTKASATKKSTTKATKKTASKKATKAKAKPKTAVKAKSKKKTTIKASKAKPIKKTTPKKTTRKKSASVKKSSSKKTTTQNKSPKKTKK